jgi:hypothetical protein
MESLIKKPRAMSDRARATHWLGSGFLMDAAETTGPEAAETPGPEAAETMAGEKMAGDSARQEAGVSEMPFGGSWKYVQVGEHHRRVPPGAS